MTLYDSIGATLPELRAQAESRMVSRCKVRRKGGTTTDPANGREAPAWTTVHADLPVRLATAGFTRTVNIGSVAYEMAAGVAHLPVSTTDIKADDHIEITSGEWAGEVYRVVDAVKADQKTALRVPVFEVKRPTEWL